MKKITKSLLLVMTMVLLCFAMSMFASAEISSGECGKEGNNIIWTHDSEEKTLTFSGNGEMCDLGAIEPCSPDDYSFYCNPTLPSLPSVYSVETIYIGENISFFDTDVFFRYSTLKNIIVDEKNKYYSSVDGVLFNNDKTILYAYPIGKTQAEYTVPNTVKTIKHFAFADSTLERIIISKGVEKAESRAFYHCRFKDVYLPLGFTFDNIGEYNDPSVYYEGSSCADWGFDSPDAFIFEYKTQSMINHTVKRLYYNTDHIHNFEIISIPPTCVSAGLKVSECSICGIWDDYNYDYPESYTGPLGHDLGEYSQTVAPTCYNEGEKRSYCSRCNHYSVLSINKLPHTYEKVVTSPTCTEQGYTTYTCECGDTYVDDYTDELDHEYTSEITTAPTHLAEGETTYTCECGYTYTEAIEKLTKHTYEEVVTEPTCTAKGYTTYTCACGDSYVDNYTDKLGHDVVIDSAVAATCTETGLTKGEHCTRCDYKVEQDEIPALGHKEIFTSYIEPTCTEDGLSVGKECSVCGEVSIPQQVIPAKGHSYTGWITTAEATCEINGKKIKLCSCGLFEEEIIPAIGHADVDNDSKCDNCSVSLTNEAEEPSAPAEKDNVFSFLKSFLNNLLDFLRKLFGIK